MEIVLFGWATINGWPHFFINGERYRGLISGRIYDQTVCRCSSGQIAITREKLLADD